MLVQETARGSKLKQDLIVAKGVFTQQWQIAKSYLPNTIVFIIVPIVMTALPILLLAAIGADENIISENFFGGNTGSINGYIAIGSNLWALILVILWDFSTYLRDEQLTGTLETLLMSPAKRYAIIIGRASFSISFNVVVSFFAMTVTLLIFDKKMLFSIGIAQLLLLILLVVVGCIPMIGLSYFIGALVLEFKEVYSLINLLQWFFGIIMGVYAPFKTLPLVLRVMGIIFPATWTVSDIRAITTGSPPMLMLLGLENIGMPIFWSTLIVLAFSAFWGLFGYFTFSKYELKIKKNEGLSKY
ncbi:MAG: ABC transporter permease [Candidatus Heimdallarchaeaceae archaeon]